jgi:hypothetical protein
METYKEEDEKSVSLTQKASSSLMNNSSVPAT